MKFSIVIVGDCVSIIGMTPASVLLSVVLFYPIYTVYNFTVVL